MTDKVVPIKDITDLCMHCLLTVFHYLDVTDLANLTEANITSSCKSRKHKNKIDQYKQSIVKAFKIKVKANKWKTIIRTGAGSAPNDIKMLRSFGREVEALLFDYGYNNTNRRYEKALEDAVTNNCSKTLSTIDFDNCNKDSMNELEQPFTNVNLVEFRDGHLGSTLGQLKKWFPQLEDLRFTDTYVFDSKCIYEHFTWLESLMVWNGRWQESEKDKMIFTNSNLKVFLRMNPQLEILDIRHDDVDESESGAGDIAIIVDWELLTYINNNSKLRILKLNLEYFRFELEWQSSVTIETIVALDIQCVNFDCLDKIKITSPKLNELNLKVDSCFDVDEPLNYEAVAMFVIRAEPKRLKIEVQCKTFDINNVQVLQITRMLPKLIQLCIDCSWADNIPDAVISFLVKSNTLIKLVVVLNFDSDDAGGPSPQFLQLRQIFHEKIVRNGVVAKTWKYSFQYKEVGCFYVDSVQFQKIE